jgi:hypothetical protein
MYKFLNIKKLSVEQYVHGKIIIKFTVIYLFTVLYNYSTYALFIF